MEKKPKKIITVRTVGTPDIELAAELFAPLLVKIHERNQEKQEIHFPVLKEAHD
jgi:hypothetical protein